MTHHTTPLLIIGGGPAGYTAAIYAARANLSPLLVEGLQPGGQLTITTDVENYPGFAEPVQGPWLMEQMRAQASAVGARLLTDHIHSVRLTGGPPFVATGEGGDTYTADSVIIATGAQARWLGLPAEEKYRGAGVSACATCDGFFYRGKKVAVVGGGNSALEEALYLAGLAAHVTVIHRRDSFRGEKVMQERVLAHPKITVLWNRTVEDITGAPLMPGGPVGVTGLRLKDTVSGTLSDLEVDGVFIAIGHTPATALFTGQLPMDAEGYLLTAPDSTATPVPGVFAAGDVKDKVYRQAVTAAGMGCMAALEAERWLATRASASAPSSSSVSP